MNKLILTLFIGSIALFSCKREKLEVVGPQAPELISASSNFQLGNTFKFDTAKSYFAKAAFSNWLNASFNERVSWEVTITGTQTKAYKVIKGVSNVIDKSNSTWTGTHSGINFFKAGEKAIARLTVLGSKEIWYDTTTIASVKDYGANPNVLILSDVDNVDATGWYDYVSSPNIKIIGISAKNPDTIGGVQGYYRSLQVSDNGQSNYWSGGYGTYGTVMTSASTKFSGVSLNNLFLNFYIRRRTPKTETMTIGITSLVPVLRNGRYALVYSSLGGYTVNIPSGAASSGSDLVPNGFVSEPRGDGWHLISIRLSSMQPEAGKPAFNPDYIAGISGSLGVYPETGFDIDYITITKGPFDPDAE